MGKLQRFWRSYALPLAHRKASISLYYPPDAHHRNSEVSGNQATGPVECKGAMKPASTLFSTHVTPVPLPSPLNMSSLCLPFSVPWKTTPHLLCLLHTSAQGTPPFMLHPMGLSSSAPIQVSSVLFPTRDLLCWLPLFCEIPCYLPKRVSMSPSPNLRQATCSV